MAATVATVAATASVVVVSTVAATAATAMSRLKLFRSCVADEEDCTFESNAFAGERVVEVHNNLFAIDVFNESGDMKTFSGHHRDKSTGLNNLVVEFSIDHEYRFFERGDLFRVVFTESFGRLSNNVESVAFHFAIEVFFERCDKSTSNTEDKSFRFFRVGLVHESFSAIFINTEKVVAYFHVFARFNLFHLRKIC